MFDGYTAGIGEAVLDLLDGDISQIWSDIQSTPEDTSADLWKKKLQKIARDYSFSSRFALMRLLFHRAGGEDPAAGFEAAVGDTLYRFADISLEHAQSMTSEEHLRYLALLTELAERQTDCVPEVSCRIIRRAWLDRESANLLEESLLPENIRQDEKALQKARKTIAKENKQAYKSLISRREALLLGHVLDFSLEEMSWFLLRVLDTEDSFSFNRSEDIIEAYGFLTGASWQHVQHLKEQVSTCCSGISKIDNDLRNNNWTRAAAFSLTENVSRWKYHPDSMDRNFLEWMKTQAPGLDLPSRTACRIYRNLAVFAYGLITGEQVIPEEADFMGSILGLCEDDRENDRVICHLYRDGSVCADCCKTVADILLLENKIQSASIQADNAKAWHILTTLNDGTISTAGGIINKSRTRIRDILGGTVQPEKGDMLYLLWFIANMVWQCSGEPDPHMLCNRILDFMDISKQVLESALLSEFYPAHLMEQSMLLSILYAGKEDLDSSVVYEYIMHSLTASRNRDKGSRKHSETEKLYIVQFYRAQQENRAMTLEECAAHFEISPKTLSEWVKNLRDQTV